MRRLAIALTLSLSLTASAPAQDIQSRVGTSAAQFLKIGVSPRAIGMGEAFVAVPRDASALYYNVSGIAFVPRADLVFSHTEWPADIGHEYIAGALAVPILGTLGTSVTVLHTDDMPVRTPLRPEGTGEFFRASDYAFGLAIARQLTNKFAIGAQVKYIRSNFMNTDFTADSWAFDVGTTYYTGFRSLRIGMALANLGTDMRAKSKSTRFRNAEPKSSESYPIPTTLTFGAAWEMLENERHTLTFAFQAVRPNDTDERVNFGAEYWFSNFVSLRGGYKLGYDTESWAFGGGVKFKASPFTTRLDYAYSDLGNLFTGAHRLSVGLGF